MTLSQKIKSKALILIPIDVFCLAISFIVAVFLRADDLMKELRGLDMLSSNAFKVVFSPASIAIVLFYLIVFLLFDLYSTLLQQITLEDAFKLGAANAVALTISIIYNYTLFPVFSGLKGNFDKFGMERIPTGVVVIAGCLMFMASTCIRGIPRFLTWVKSTWAAKKDGLRINRVLIYGAGDTGVAIFRELSRPENKSRVVAFYDDDDTKAQRKINNVRIYGKPKSVPDIVNELSINEIIIAIPTADPEKIHEIVNECKDSGCKIRKMPAITDMITDGDAKMKMIRDVEIADLLGRKEVLLDTDSISGYLEGSVVLVTGGGGSIGSELCRQIIKYNPKKLIILDIYENNAYDLENELRRTYGKDIPVMTYIASVRDYKRMTDIFDIEKPDVVFHAAAHKHVPLMEDSPGEAIKNNVFGTYNTATVAHEHNVKNFVLISTDKAVNPTNIMGATKRIAEIIIQAYSKISETNFVAVRFGNVLGSNGSVIPLFKKQIENMGPVTVTHPEITRFFMTIPEASKLVIQAGAMAKGGEIFILDMGEPVKIADLARDLIKLSGYKPDVDIKIEYTGLRPGEKLYEELLRAEEGVTASEREGFFVAEPFFMEWEGVQNMLADFKDCINSPHKEVAETLKRYIPTFTSKDL